MALKPASVSEYVPATPAAARQSLPSIHPSLLTVNRRVDFSLLIDALGVFNGDPDNNGMQRIDTATNRGIVTDVAVKRLVRDTEQTLLDNGYPPHPTLGNGLYMSHRAIINPKHDDVYKAAGVEAGREGVEPVPAKVLPLFIKDGEPIALPDQFSLRPAEGKDGDWELVYTGALTKDDLRDAMAVFVELGQDAKKLAGKVAKAAKAPVLSDDNLAKLQGEMCRRWRDVRKFGGVGSTGNSIGNVKGPIQFEMGYSFDPVGDSEITLATSIIRRPEDADVKRQELARKPIVHYGLYRINGFFNAPLAQISRLTAEDLQLFWTAILYLGRFTHSATRPHIELAAAYCFVHDLPIGNAHAHELFDRIHVTKAAGVTSPRNFRDYHVHVLADELPKGIELVTLYERRLTDHQAAQSA